MSSRNKCAFINECTTDVIKDCLLKWCYLNSICRNKKLAFLNHQMKVETSWKIVLNKHKLIQVVHSICQMGWKMTQTYVDPSIGTTNKSTKWGHRSSLNPVFCRLAYYQKNHIESLEKYPYFKTNVGRCFYDRYLSLCAPNLTLYTYYLRHTFNSCSFDFLP